MFGHIIELDRQLFLAVNQAHAEWMDRIMILASNKFTWIPLYAVLLFFIFYKIRKKTGAGDIVPDGYYLGYMPGNITNGKDNAGHNRNNITGNGKKDIYKDPGNIGDGPGDGPGYGNRSGKKYARKSGRFPSFSDYSLDKRNFKISLIVLGSVLLGFALCDSLSVAVFKDNIHRLRPCYDPLTESLTRVLEKKGSYYGFISNHAANVFGLATITLFFFRKTGYTYFILGWAVLISYSRIYVGKHFPLDVICGALFGIFIGYVICKTAVFICSRYRIRLSLQPVPDPANQSARLTGNPVVRLSANRSLRNGADREAIKIN